MIVAARSVNAVLSVESSWLVVGRCVECSVPVIDVRRHDGRKMSVERAAGCVDAAGWLASCAVGVCCEWVVACETSGVCVCVVVTVAVWHAGCIEKLRQLNA